ncbi:MAG TPA: hypothetical protein VMD04_01340, partial [Candidatus Margulisiibacteriota bacterium]|nr:hypothetical protein [Candidatus Margulisiibacteriota bacterium]
RLFPKGYLSLEYAFLIAVVVAALLGTSVYLKRAVSGRWRDLGETFGYGRQFEPGLTTETKTFVTTPVDQKPPTNGKAYLETLWTCFSGSVVDRTPMPSVTDAQYYAGACTGACNQQCGSGYTCTSDCMNYCAAVCALLPSAYLQPCRQTCGTGG